LFACESHHQQHKTVFGQFVAFCFAVAKACLYLFCFKPEIRLKERSLDFFKNLFDFLQNVFVLFIECLSYKFASGYDLGILDLDEILKID